MWCFCPECNSPRKIEWAFAQPCAACGACHPLYQNEELFAETLAREKEREQKRARRKRRKRQS